MHEHGKADQDRGTVPQEHLHSHEHSWWEKLADALHLPGSSHTHTHPVGGDAVLKSELGIRTLKQALLLLGATTLIQAAVYIFSGSVALLADTVHNLGDALNSIPLWIAFVLSRRAATRRFTYGYGRAEDVAGLLIVLSIAFSAGYIMYESISKIIDPQAISYGFWVAMAAVIGFLGNEAVAVLQIRVGKQIGSDAMVTDGRHARVDGLTSLAVLPAVIGSWLDLPVLDPIFGILIGAAIVFITWEAIQAIWYRLMDAVDPKIVVQAERILQSHRLVSELTHLRMRWVGHSLYLEGSISVREDISLPQLRQLPRELEQALKKEIPHLAEATIAAA